MAKMSTLLQILNMELEKKEKGKKKQKSSYTFASKKEFSTFDTH